MISIGQTSYDCPICSCTTHVWHTDGVITAEEKGCEHYSEIGRDGCPVWLTWCRACDGNGEDWNEVECDKCNGTGWVVYSKEDDDE